MGKIKRNVWFVHYKNVVMTNGIYDLCYLWLLWFMKNVIYKNFVLWQMYLWKTYLWQTYYDFCYCVWRKWGQQERIEKMSRTKMNREKNEQQLEVLT